MNTEAKDFKKWPIPFTKVNSWCVERRQTKTVSNDVPVWTSIKPILALVVVSPCWRHETLYQTQSQTILKCWLINSIISASFWMLLFMCNIFLLFFSFLYLWQFCFSRVIILVWRERARKKRAHLKKKRNYFRMSFVRVYVCVFSHWCLLLNQWNVFWCLTCRSRVLIPWMGLFFFDYKYFLRLLRIHKVE